MIYEKSFASHPKSKYWSKNNNIISLNVSKSSHDKYLFECDKCNHTFKSNLNNITNNNTWCPYCVNRKLCEDNNCKTCFQNSFASNEKSKYWSKQNKLVPRQVFKNSSKKILFDCNCGHQFNTILSSITTNNTWCPYCCIPQLILCENIECNNCLKKSFASHEKSKFWSNENKLKPRQVLISSSKIFKFDCYKCTHDFQCNLNNITNNNNWCPFCSNQQLCKNKNCQACFDKSFASYIKSEFWSNKNILKPRQVFKGSSKKYYFNCNKCNNEFFSSLNAISNGRWCNNCKFKTELKLFEWLKKNYNDVKVQITFVWSQKKRYDFVIKNIIIELDGPQHFRQVSNWISPKENKINDDLKNKLAHENGYRMIRICQEIVLNDLEYWKSQLKDSIDQTCALIKIGKIYLSCF